MLSYCFIFTFFNPLRRNDEKVRKIQEAQRKKKEEEKEKHKEKSMEGMKRKKALASYSTNDEVEGDKEDDDAQYYREEVGEEPEKGENYLINSNNFQVNFILMFNWFLDLFTTRVKSSKSSLSGPAAKRAKIEKKKFTEKNAKQSKGGKVGFKKNQDDGEREFRRKGFKPGQKNDKPYGNKPRAGGKGKPGFKGASKIQSKGRKHHKSRK